MPKRLATCGITTPTDTNRVTHERGTIVHAPTCDGETPKQSCPPQDSSRRMRKHGTRIEWGNPCRPRATYCRPAPSHDSETPVAKTAALLARCREAMATNHQPPGPTLLPLPPPTGLCVRARGREMPQSQRLWDFLHKSEGANTQAAADGRCRRRRCWGLLRGRERVGWKLARMASLQRSVGLCQSTRGAEVLKRSALEVVERRTPLSYHDAGRARQAQMGREMQYQCNCHRSCLH